MLNPLLHGEQFFKNSGTLSDSPCEDALSRHLRRLWALRVPQCHPGPAWAEPHRSPHVWDWRRMWHAETQRRALLRAVASQGERRQLKGTGRPSSPRRAVMKPGSPVCWFCLAVPRAVLAWVIVFMQCADRRCQNRSFIHRSIRFCRRHFSSAHSVTSRYSTKW